MPASRPALALGFALLLSDTVAAETFLFQGRVDVIPPEVAEATERALASPTCLGPYEDATAFQAPAVAASGGATVTAAPVEGGSGNGQIARNSEADLATTEQESVRLSSCVISVVYE